MSRVSRRRSTGLSSSWGTPTASGHHGRRSRGGQHRGPGVHHRLRADAGESVLDICGRFPGSKLLAALRPGTVADGSADPLVELHIDHEEFPPLFAADLPRQTAAAAAAAQRPMAATAFAEKARAAAWKA